MFERRCRSAQRLEVFFRHFGPSAAIYFNTLSIASARDGRAPIKVSRRCLHSKYASTLRGRILKRTRTIDR
jgi:hypothetical protein